MQNVKKQNKKCRYDLIYSAGFLSILSFVVPMRLKDAMSGRNHNFQLKHNSKCKG